MRRIVLAATILMVASGCDKNQYARKAERKFDDLIGRVSGQTAANQRPAPARLDLSQQPTILFQIFGQRSDPRLIPIAAVERGKLRRIVLTGEEWREFTRRFTAPGDTLPLYADGRRAGSVVVRRGMWDRPDSALYSLPGCEHPLPLAAVDLRGNVGRSATVEMLASNAALGQDRRDSGMTPAQVREAARDIGLLVGAKVGMSPRTLDSLDFNAVAVQTGATPRPTLAISYTEPVPAGAPAGFIAKHLFVLADAGDFGYRPSFWHWEKGGPTPNYAGFRRYLEHLDVDGDGVDEMVLEGWSDGRGSFPIILGFRNYQWMELYRGSDNWCLDAAVTAAEDAA